MVKIDYLDALQVEVCVIVIVALGYLCGGIKMFTGKEALSMRRTIFLIAMPGLVFREIAIHKLNLNDWHPLFNGILVQITVHIIYVLIVLIFRPKSKKYVLISMLYSTSYMNFIFFGYPIIQVLFGDHYVHIPTIQFLVLHFICVPLHTFLSFDSNERSESESVSAELEDETNNPIDKASGLPIYPVNDKSNENEQTTKEDDSVEEVSIDENNDGPSNDTESENIQNSKEKFKDRHPKIWAVLWSIITPSNVCAILGIIWSATGVDLPVFLNDFANDLEKATLASGLFTCGVLMWEHPFFGCSLVKIMLTLFVHYVIIPLISLFWNKICKVDSITATINVLVHSMPAALIIYPQSFNSGWNMSTVSFSFFWSILLFLPMFILWVIALNEINIF